MSLLLIILAPSTNEPQMSEDMSDILGFVVRKLCLKAVVTKFVNYFSLIRNTLIEHVVGSNMSIGHKLSLAMDRRMFKLRGLFIIATKIEV